MLDEQSRDLSADGSAPQAGHVDEIVSFRSTISPDMDFTKAVSASRQLSKFRGKDGCSGAKVRVAVLGSTTTTQLTSFVDLFLFAQNVDAEIYEAPYGLLRQEILDPASQLYQFAPQFVFLATTRRDLGALPAVSASAEAVDAAVEHAAGEWLALCQTLHDRLGCQIIQNNFDVPPWRVFGTWRPSTMGHRAVSSRE
jgi:predicted enzyme involved in methoxymalonyl-ACP biosynthesis